jgi:hypothetical protein
MFEKFFKIKNIKVHFSIQYQVVKKNIYQNGRPIVYIFVAGIQLSDSRNLNQLKILVPDPQKMNADSQFCSLCISVTFTGKYNRLG